MLTGGTAGKVGRIFRQNKISQQEKILFLVAIELASTYVGG